MEQRFTFDQIARVYRVARPDYPQALVEDVLSYADLKPDDRILEVGCGTGQATKSFAKRGFRILATDPGPEMLRGAQETLASFGNVEFLETTFEAFPAGQEAFRLIIAAQSWHWVSPEVRFAKAAKALSPDGALAVFGHVPVGFPAPLLQAFKEIYLRHIGKWGLPPEAWYLPGGPFKRWFDEPGLFGPVQHKSYPWIWQHTTSSYIDLLHTRSDHRMMKAEKREAMLGEIARTIDDHGGTLDVNYETHLYMARRLSHD
ncbi:class I SAM-dependent methyltransferase [Bradyrhizobium sp. CB3481]|uniref:class I SAM-dependent methyltransferase n=1 Tax=Bradyrhizobium sp. CB3481 TaxID=3039158 RepID=UPI0024B209B9|nr:class I SAM-dependent methyltransferase [Bradyrhizobium sp. CB3481]WFU19238.1 methyltransferase domain-containing protein [Bradyrhizobium sp. CB3481]